MAEAKSTKVKKVRRLKSQTVRERADKAVKQPAKPRRLKKTAATAAKPLKAVGKLHKKEYYLPLPDNKLGRFLNKRRSFIPRYFREAWAELRQVTWPTRRETIKLTFAVVMFAIVFAVIIGVVDYGLDKVFRRILL